SDPISMRRPAGLHTVAAGRHLSFLSGRYVDDAQTADAARTISGKVEGTVGDGDLFPVGRPARIETEVGHTLDRLSGRAHDEDPSRFAFGSEGDPLAVGGKCRLPIVDLRIGGQGNRVSSSDAQEVKTKPASGIANVNDALAVGRQ